MFKSVYCDVLSDTVALGIWGGGKLGRKADRQPTSQGWRANAGRRTAGVSKRREERVSGIEWISTWNVIGKTCVFVCCKDLNDDLGLYVQQKPVVQIQATIKDAGNITD